jgi:hypothetical protein
MFAVFERRSAKDRFALHVENKLPNGTLTRHQAKGYRVRAQFMANRPAFLNDSGHRTVILACQRFQQRNSESCAEFDCRLTYEDISVFLPIFGEVLQ